MGSSAQQGEEGLRGEATKLRRLAPDRPHVGCFQVRRLRRRHRARERKGSGYYGCLNASRRSCENKVLISRRRLEDKLLGALNHEVLKPDVLEAVYERTAKKIKEHFAHVPEELRLKKVELNRAGTRGHNRIHRRRTRTPGLADALSQAEDKVKTLSADVSSMEAAKSHAFTPPPRAWIADRITRLNDLLAKRTEQSALARSGG
jgi:hypothetical protein